MCLVTTKKLNQSAYQKPKQLTVNKLHKNHKTLFTAFKQPKEKQRYFATIKVCSDRFFQIADKVIGKPAS